jgi:ligand-binding SRPBCC domain-containing protein
MQVFTITAKIPKAVEEVFKYITTPDNFPRWKKDVWVAGRKYGCMGDEFKMIQTVYLMSPRQFMMHVTGFEQNKYFKFQALKGFGILPGWSFSFKPCGESTLLTVVSEINPGAGTIRGFLYPMGLYHHWKMYFELLSRELFSSPSMIQILSFEELNREASVLTELTAEIPG